MQNLLSIPTAAERAGVHRSAIYQAIHGGRLGHVAIAGHYFIYPRDLERWMKTRKISGKKA